MGDSPVLSMCVVRDKVWMGFEIGYLMMFETHSKRPYVQVSVHIVNRLMHDTTVDWLLSEINHAVDKIVTFPLLWICLLLDLTLYTKIINYNSDTYMYLRFYKLFVEPQPQVHVCIRGDNDKTL